jgi:hypothetical protein
LGKKVLHRKIFVVIDHRFVVYLFEPVFFLLGHELPDRITHFVSDNNFVVGLFQNSKQQLEDIISRPAVEERLRILN